MAVNFSIKVAENKHVRIRTNTWGTSEEFPVALGIMKKNVSEAYLSTAQAKAIGKTLLAVAESMEE